MREILFRGKRLDNGEWIYGYYAKLPHPITAFLKDYIVEVKFDETDVVGETDYVLVNPKTVGQFTGLLDKNGNKIFEGDIVEVEEKEYQYNEVITNKYQATVVFRESCFKLVEENDLMDMIYNKADKCKVIGNIYDKEKENEY